MQVIHSQRSRQRLDGRVDSDMGLRERTRVRFRRGLGDLLGGLFSQFSQMKTPSKDSGSSVLGMTPYIYTGKLELSTYKVEDLVAILQLAHEYGLVNIQQPIVDYLKKKLDISNVLIILRTAALLFDDLTESCMKFADQHASDVLASKNFLTLQQKAVEEVLTRDSFYAPEIDIFKAICEWIRAQPLAKETSPETLIERFISKKCLRLDLIHQKELLSTVRHSELFAANSVAFRDFILDALNRKCEGTVSDMRGAVVLNENVATVARGAAVVEGENRDKLLRAAHGNRYDGNTSLTRHRIGQTEGIVVQLGRPYTINSVILQIGDCGTGATYSYKIELEKEREAHKITASEKKNLEKVMWDAEQQLTRTEEEVQKLTEKLDIVAKQRQTAEEGKAEVEEQLRKPVNASSLDQSALAKELSGARTLCAQRLAEMTRLQAVVKSLEDKVQSLESGSSQLTQKLTMEELHFHFVRCYLEGRMEYPLLSDQGTQGASKMLKMLGSMKFLRSMLSCKSWCTLSSQQKRLRWKRLEKRMPFEIDAVMAEMKRAENKLNALSARVRELEEKHVEIQKAMEAECKEKVSNYEAHDAELQEELSAANEKNAELKTLSSAHLKEGETVQVLKKELAAVSLSADYLKEEER
ncbi:unnamed protein product [Heligmosomoides polygyrus]|uniref:BACK domain-containing protein n=1 Tax=Heligmosomoides polygyrus TaxID=6339 RepID=A0A3P8C9Z2_HELPZ|nr:unnamed protein product [Heligmosomoides polygyrus]